MEILKWDKHLQSKKQKHVSREIAQHYMMLAIKDTPRTAKRKLFDCYKSTSKKVMTPLKRLSFDGDKYLQFEHSEDQDARTGLPKKVRLVDDATKRIIFHYEAGDEHYGTAARSVLCYPNNTAVEFHPETIVWPISSATRWGENEFFNFLPLDCLYCVLSLLDPDTLLRCRLVSTVWCAVASDDSLWKAHTRKLAPCVPAREYSLFKHYIRGTFRGMLHQDDNTRKERLAAFLSSPQGISYFVHIVQTNNGTRQDPVEVERNIAGWRLRARWKTFAYGIQCGTSCIMATTLIPYDIVSWIRCYLANLKNE